MIDRATSLQRVRMPIVAIAAFALGALASAALPQLHLATSAPAPIVITQTPSMIPPIVSTVRVVSTTACGSGAYVTGDMAGDASPASVLATMCGK